MRRPRQQSPMIRSGKKNYKIGRDASHDQWRPVPLSYLVIRGLGRLVQCVLGFALVYVVTCMAMVL